MEALEPNEIAQEDRWRWLEQYHSWLRNLPQNQVTEENGTTEQESLARSSEYDGDKRCYAKPELKRTKALFLKDKAKLEVKLDALGKRHSAVLRLKTAEQRAQIANTATPSRLPVPRRTEVSPLRANTSHVLPPPPVSWQASGMKTTPVKPW